MFTTLNFVGILYIIYYFNIKLQLLTYFYVFVDTSIIISISFSSIVISKIIVNNLEIYC